MKQTSTKVFLGFTIIELVVSIAIMATLTTIILANFRSGERSRRVQFAADQIVQDFRSIQNSVQTGAVSLNTTCAQGKIPANLFITIPTGAVGYDIMARDKCGSAFSVRTSTLPAQTRITSLSLNNSTANSVTVRTDPPFATLRACVNASCSPASFSEVKITVGLSTDASISREVTVNGLSGQITQ